TSGQTTSNLKVLEVGDGTTAASLGLAAINAASNVADGTDILRAFGDLTLSQLHQGTGVRFDNALADLQIQFRDGTTQTVDFHRLSIAGTRPTGVTQGEAGANAQV